MLIISGSGQVDKLRFRGARGRQELRVCRTTTAALFTRRIYNAELLVHQRCKFSSKRIPVCATAPSSTESGSGFGFVNFTRTVFPTALALLLCNMDRICLSVAMVPIAAELAWAEGIQGIVQSAFLWGYLATQLIGGTLADKYGGKIVMGLGIAWFSIASALLPAVALTPWTTAAGLTLPAVLAARFLVGVGEGVALPSMNSLFAKAIPSSSRSTALGLAFSGFHSGNLIGLIVSPLIVAAAGWRRLFYSFSLMGLPVLFFWFVAVPKVKSSAVGENITIVEEEAIVFKANSSGRLVRSSSKGVTVSVSQFLSNKATWAIIFANIVNHWGYFIYLNWMPTYFYKVLNLNLSTSSYFSLLPWIAMAVGSSMAGLIADGLVRLGVGKKAVRRLMQTVAFLGPVAALLVLSRPGISATKAVLSMTAALGITSLGQAGFVANMSDIAPSNAGRLFGLCNTFGSLAGIFGVSAAGFIVERTGSFAAVFLLTAALNIAGSILWNVLCDTEKQF